MYSNTSFKASNIWFDKFEMANNFAVDFVLSIRAHSLTSENQLTVQIK